jgi:Mrp family chromosome partitioning ATPase/capsular polysaccharide biosynthesis protein
MHNGSGANTARLGDYFVMLRRQWPVVLLCLALGIGAALAYLHWAPKEYRSTTSVLVTAMETDSSSERGATINLDTEAQLVTSTQTVSRAADALGISAGTAADRISVSVPPNTEILDLTYVGGTAGDAQEGSRAFADAYLAQREANAQAILDNQADALQSRIDAVQKQLDAADKEAADLPENSGARARAEDEASRLDQQLSTLESNQARLRTETLTPGNVVTEPRLPSSPSSPDPLITIAAGVLLGALLGLGVAALRDRADDVIRTPDDLFRRTRVPVAAVLSTRLNGGQVNILKPLSADGRGYARLRNLVTTSLEESDRRVVLVAGVRRGGGPVAANLAASLARSGEQVYLICADVFGPTATALLGQKGRPGLAEVLAGEVPLDEATRPLDTVPNLHILPPGPDPDRADALLQTKGPRKLVDDLLATASYVVIEAPPTTDSPDAQTLAGVADLAVLVVEAGQSSAREVIDAVAQVESMHAAVLGAVIARYGRDGDPVRSSNAVARDDDTDDLDELEDAAADVDESEKPADVKADADVPVEEPVRAAELVRTGATAASAVPVVDHDETDAETTVLPTGGRPQLVPPGSAGSAQR